MKRIAVIAMAVILGGCGPSMSSLVVNKHYREAICAANDGGDGARANVATAVATDSELYLHIHVLSPKSSSRCSASRRKRSRAGRTSSA